MGQEWEREFATVASFVAETEGSSCPNLRNVVRNGPRESRSKT